MHRSIVPLPYRPRNDGFRRTIAHSAGIGPAVIETTLGVHTDRSRGVVTVETKIEYATRSVGVLKAIHHGGARVAVIHVEADGGLGEEARHVFAELSDSLLIDPGKWAD